jgi:hypothetical protein
MTLVSKLRDRFGVEPVLRVLGVSVSTFYGWVARRRHASPRDIEETWLGEQIQRIHASSDKAYGSPKVWAQLRREGIRVSRKRVEQLMRQAGLQARSSATASAPAPAATPRPRPHRTWSTVTSRPTRPTGCGLRISRASPPGRARCGWPACGTRSRGGWWAGRPTPSWCWARWSTPCGAATSNGSGWSFIATTGRSLGSRGRCNTPADVSMVGGRDAVGRTLCCRSSIAAIAVGAQARSRGGLPPAPAARSALDGAQHRQRMCSRGAAMGRG